MTKTLGSAGGRKWVSRAIAPVMLTLMSAGCGHDCPAAAPQTPEMQPLPGLRDAGRSDAAQWTWMPRDAGKRGELLDAGDDPVARQCRILFDIQDQSELPVCAAETRTCIESCQGDGCSDVCLEADPSAGAVDFDCSSCVFLGMMSCLADGGCSNEVNGFMCCLEAQCLNDESDCAQTRCGDELQVAVSCGIGGPLSCLAMGGAHNAHCFHAHSSGQDGGGP